MFSCLCRPWCWLFRSPKVGGCRDPSAWAPKGGGGRAFSAWVSVMSKLLLRQLGYSNLQHSRDLRCSAYQKKEIWCTSCTHRGAILRFDLTFKRLQLTSEKYTLHGAIIKKCAQRDQAYQQERKIVHMLHRCNTFLHIHKSWSKIVRNCELPFVKIKLSIVYFPAERLWLSK